MTDGSTEHEGTSHGTPQMTSTATDTQKVVHALLCLRLAIA